MDCFVEIYDRISKQAYIKESCDFEYEMKLFDQIEKRHRQCNICIYCNKKHWNYIPENTPSDSIVCVDCGDKIVVAQIRRLNRISTIIQSKKQCQEDILEIGMHPDRIRQTRLFQYDWLL